MKRTIIIVAAICVFACATIVLAWVSLMGHINSTQTVFEVQVSGGVDQVLFYRTAGSEQPVATITTNGQPTRTSVSLQNATRSSFLVQQGPAKYYYVAKKGDQSYTSPAICCETGFSNKTETLTIRGLNDWEKSEGGH